MKIIEPHQKKLSKPFWEFKNKVFDMVCTQAEYEQLMGRKMSKKMVEGIYVNGHLYYIGSTQDFEKRFKEHQAKLKADSKELYVYKLIHKGDDVKFEILIKTKDIKVEIQKIWSLRLLHCISLLEIQLVDYSLTGIMRHKKNFR